MRSKRRRTAAFCIPVLCGLLIIIVFQFFLVLGYVPSASMEPTISRGSLILGLRLYGALHRNDMVIFRKEGQMIVKRIVAVPGDSVFISMENIIMPEGCYYLLGDNRAESRDSRHWEEPYIREANILAKVL